ncbi:MAG: MarR family winged helix-turn-helix transcriptional regulator [Pseudomonadota bacterium]
MSIEEFDLLAFLPYRLAVLSERVSRRLSAEYARLHGLSVAEWRVMVHLLSFQEVSIREICDYANLDKPKASRAVARLEQNGWVRKKSAEGDGRLVAISLTEEGHKVMEDIIPAAKDVERNLLEALSPADHIHLGEIVEKLHAVLDRDPKARPRAQKSA